MSAADTSIRRHRLTVDEYYRMAEVGLLAPDARVELIEGEIIDMAPIGSEHAAMVDRLARRLVQALRGRATVGSQRPVRLDARSEPQPDVLVLRHRADDYSKAHPTPNDVWLIVEVSDTSLAYDRMTKAPLYAKHGIPELWIIDLAAKEVHVAREPHNGMYSSIHTVRTGTVEFAALGDVPVEIEDLLDLQDPAS